MASRTPELLHEIRRLSIEQKQEYVDMTAYLRGLGISDEDLSHWLKGVEREGWIVASPKLQVGSAYLTLALDTGGQRLGLLPQGLVYLEEREREHKMMEDMGIQAAASRDSAEAAKTSAQIAKAALDESSVTERRVFRLAVLGNALTILALIWTIAHDSCGDKPVQVRLDPAQAEALRTPITPTGASASDQPSGPSTYTIRESVWATCGPCPSDTVSPPRKK